MLTECQDCGHKFYLQGTDLDNIVGGGGCPSCGSHDLYRTQVPPTESEMTLRNMVDPATGVDAGGNPLQEGIYADTDGGWKARDKRDESFASVRTAEFNMMDFNFGDDNRQETHKFVVLPSGAVHSIPTQPGVDSHHEDIANKYKLHELGYPKSMSLGLKHDDGSVTFLQHEAPLGPGQLAERLESHFGEPVTIDPGLKPTTNEERWGIQPNRPSGRPLRELERLYGPATPRPGYRGDMYGMDEGLVRGGSVDETFNMEPYVPWAHQADFEDENPVPASGTQEQVTPGPYGIHAGTVRWLQFFDASVDGLNARTQGQEIIRRFGVRNSPEFGKPVTLSVHHPEHLAAAAEAIATSANGNQPTPLIKEIGAGLKAGTVPFPPGMSPENMRGASTKTAFLPLLLEGLGMLGEGGAAAGAAGEAGAAGGGGMLGGLGGSAAGPLMRGALMGTGSHLVGDILGKGPQPAQAQQELPPEDLPPAVTGKTADLETPSSVPSIGEHANSPEDVDQKELNDGEQAEQLQGGDQEAGGSQGFSPETLGEFDALLPRILHYYNLDESAANDPVIRALHEKLEAEQPGYLDSGDDSSVEQLLEQLRKPHDHVTAAGPIGIAPATGPGAAGLQPGPAAPGIPGQPQSGGPCPYCGGTRLADGSCPQCGAKSSPMGGALPGSQPPVGTSQPSYPMTAAADHQGPANPEQLKAVAELLIGQGRAEEIPHMIEAPWEYADELAEIQNKPNDPPSPDESPSPEAQQQAVAMPPSMPVADPSQQIAAAVARFSADNIAKRCPACGSATTAILNDKGDSRCHACGNIWKEKHVVKEVTSEAHDHAELHHHDPIQGVPAADQEGQRDVENEQDSSLSWQTDSGDPLQVGQEYEMHSAKYDVPDIIRITAVKPDSIEFEITGEYDLGHVTEVSKEEADIEGLSFQPVEASDKDDAGEDGNDYLTDQATPPRQNTVPTPAASAPFTTSVKTAEFPEGTLFPPCESCGKVAGYRVYPFARGFLECKNCHSLEDGKKVADRFNKIQMDHSLDVATLPETQHPLGDHTGAHDADGNWYDEQFQGDRDKAEEWNDAGDFRIGDRWYDGGDGDLIPHEAAVADYELLNCPNCASTHVSSQMTSPTSTMHDCYKCGHFWEEHEADEAGEADERRAWVMGSGPADVDEGPAHAYAGLDFVPRASNAQTRNIHDIAKRDPRYAGKKFTPLEQRGFIDEQGEARNMDRLNLEGTHYKVRDDWTGKANGLNAPDEHLVLGL